MDIISLDKKKEMVVQKKIRVSALAAHEKKGHFPAALPTLHFGVNNDFGSPLQTS
jgi:hypothetical protein